MRCEKLQRKIILAEHAFLSKKVSQNNLVDFMPKNGIAHQNNPFFS